MDEASCAKCRHWKPDSRPALKIGECRRYAQRPQDDGGWVNTLDSDWCGEFAEQNGSPTPAPMTDAGIQELAEMLAPDIEQDYKLDTVRLVIRSAIRIVLGRNT